MKKTEKYPPELPRELLGRMCIDRDGAELPEELFDLVSLPGDGGGCLADAPSVRVEDLRRDEIAPSEGRGLLTGRTENGFAVTDFNLTSDISE